MKRSDLEARLRSIRVPERPAEYWEDFPARIRVQLPRNASLPPVRESTPAGLFWKWGLGFAAVILAGVALNQPLKAASQAVSQKEHSIRQQLATLPAHLQILMTDQHGLAYLVTDKE